MLSNATHSVEEMARAGCTSPRGLRWWEDKGLLGDVARSAGDTRRYTDEQLDRARIIAAAQFGGFDLETIGKMVVEYDLEVREALLMRLSDQVRAAARLGEQLPTIKPVQEYDL